METTDRRYILSCSLPEPTEAHLTIVMAAYNGGFVTWIHNSQDGGDYFGHYHATELEARVEWTARVLEYLNWRTKL